MNMNIDRKRVPYIYLYLISILIIFLNYFTFSSSGSGLVSTVFVLHACRANKRAYDISNTRHTAHNQLQLAARSQALRSFHDSDVPMKWRRCTVGQVSDVSAQNSRIFGSTENISTMYCESLHIWWTYIFEL